MEEAHKHQLSIAIQTNKTIPVKQIKPPFVGKDFRIHLLSESLSIEKRDFSLE